MKPFKFQEAGIDFLIQAGRAILADEMGLGKTMQALLAARGKTLIVAPAAFETIWDDAIDEWRHLLDPSLDIWFCAYSKLCRRQGSKTFPALNPELTSHWDTVIFDEAHYIKNRKANWTKAAEKLKSDRLYLLTGTPLPNWSHEIYMTLKFLYPGDSRFSNYWRWLDEWFILWDSPWGSTEIKGIRKDRTWEQFFVQNGLQGRWLRRTQEECLGDLPPMRFQVDKLDLASKQGKAYKALKKDLYVELDSGAEILAWSQGGMYTKLHRVSTALQLEDPASQSSNKFDMLNTILDERESRHTLVLCRFRDTVAAIAGSYSGDAIAIHGGVAPRNRGELVREFQEGDKHILVATLDTIAEGYTLTRADCAVFVERHPRPSKNNQAAGRIRRIGQTKPCLQIDLVSRDTVDSSLSNTVRRKTDEQMAAMTVFDLMQEE